MINTLERLAIAVVGACALIFVYGTLSMAWAGADRIHMCVLLLQTGPLALPAPLTEGECIDAGIKIGQATKRDSRWTYILLPYADAPPLSTDPNDNIPKGD